MNIGRLQDQRIPGQPRYCRFVATLLLALGLCGPAAAQTQVGPFEITGYYQLSANPSSGHINPNNFGLLDRPGAPNFLLLRQLLDLRVYGKFDDSWSVFFQPRFFHDITKSADARLPQYESLPAKFSGGDGVLVRGGGKDFKAELWQAYTDYRKGNLWLRLGKQSIAWGEAVALRVLDTVNPLDLSQSIFFDRAAEEFDAIRVPQWFLRANYTIPNTTMPDLTAEFLLNPGAVVPTLLPPQGSPYNVVPSVVKITEKVNQGEPTIGGRLTGTATDVQFSLNFITKPNDDAVGVFRSIALLPSPPFAEVRFDGKHPRVYIVGGSMNYVWQSAGAVLRAETTVTPNAPFQSGAAALKIVERPVWKSVLAVDRPTYLIPELDSMSIGFQFFETFTGGDGLHKVRSSGAKVDQAVHQFSIFIQQPLFQKRVTLEFLAVLDTDDAHWLQPGIHWEIGTNTRLDLFYNEFGGAEKRAGRFGNFFWADGAFFRFTYGF
jgi:hypothetical protein